MTHPVPPGDPGVGAPDGGAKPPRRARLWVAADVVASGAPAGAAAVAVAVAANDPDKPAEAGPTIGAQLPNFDTNLLSCPCRSRPTGHPRCRAQRGRRPHTTRSRRSPRVQSAGCRVNAGSPPAIAAQRGASCVACPGVPPRHAPDDHPSGTAQAHAASGSLSAGRRGNASSPHRTRSFRMPSASPSPPLSQALSTPVPASVTGHRLWVSALMRDEHDRLLIIAPRGTGNGFFRLPGGEALVQVDSPVTALRSLLWTQLGVDIAPGVITAVNHERPVLPDPSTGGEPGLHLTFDCGRTTSAHAQALIVPDPRLVNDWRFATLRDIRELAHPYQTARITAAVTAGAGLPFVEQPHRRVMSAPPSACPDPDAEAGSPTAPASHPGSGADDGPTAVLPTIGSDAAPHRHRPVGLPPGPDTPEKASVDADNERTVRFLDDPGGLAFLQRVLEGLLRLDADEPTVEIPTGERDVPR